MSAPDSLHVLAGDCLVSTDETIHRGEVVVLVKPDDTVLVHDIDGYQPVAWLTRAESVARTRNGGFSLTAIAGDRTLRVESKTAYGFGEYPGSQAGIPLGECPNCEHTLVRAGGLVSCLGCESRYGLPDGASVLDARCDCGLPKMRVARGAVFELCLDRGCESLDEAVRDRFDGEWDCPGCDGVLRIIRRGGLLAGCENYPDCEVGYVIPSGTAEGTCDCGLPVFETPRGRRCLDGACGTGDR